MAYVPEIFVDHAVEFPNRRKLTAVSGQADTFDVTRAEGTVFAEGTKPDAANLNAEFGKIKTETDAINTSLNAEIDKTVYSTAEKRIGTWTDGKPIYRKLIYGFSITVSNTSWTTIVSSASMNISTLVRGDLFGLNISNACAVRDRGGYIEAQCLFNGGTFGGADSLMLEYTKTTD